MGFITRLRAIKMTKEQIQKKSQRLLFFQCTAYKDLLRPQLHGAIYRPDSFVLMLRYCANLKAIRYESTSLNRVLADKLHRAVVA